MAPARGRGRIRLYEYVSGIAPWEQITAVLIEAKCQGLPWNTAWQLAMKALSPERTSGLAAMIRPELEADRDLLREIKPFLKALYLGVEPDLDEVERAQSATEKRLDALMAPD